MTFYQSIGLKHADSRSRYPLVDGIFPTEQMLEHFLLVGSGYTNSCVTDLEHPFGGSTFQLKGHLSTCWGVLQCVAYQVVDNGVYLVPVYPSFQRFGSTFQSKSKLFFFCIRLERLQEILQVIVQFHLDDMQLGCIEFLFLEVYQPGSQLSQSVCILDGCLQVAQALFGQGFGTADFTQWSLDECQWSSDIVCRMNEELDFLSGNHAVLA